MLLEQSESSTLTQTEMHDISRFLEDRAQERRQVSIRNLSFFADGNELDVSFDVFAAKSISFDVAEGLQKLEVKARQLRKDVPLAIQWLDWNSYAPNTDHLTVRVEGGKQFDFRIKYEKDNDGRITGARMNLAYSEQTKLGAIQLSWNRLKYRFSSSKRSWSSWGSVAVQAAFLLVCTTVGVITFFVGRRSAISTSQNSSQPAVTITGQVSAEAASTPAVKTGNIEAQQPPNLHRDSIVARKSVPRTNSGALTARYVKPTSGGSPTPPLDSGSENPPTGAVAFSEQTRSARAESNVSFLGVRTVYVDSASFGDEAFAKSVSEVFSGPNGLSRISRFTVSASSKQADAVLRGTAVGNDVGWEISVRLVNRAGKTIWPGKVNVSGTNERQLAEEAVRKIVEKLQADLKQ